MRVRTVAIVVTCAATLALFAVFVRELSFISVGLAGNADVEKSLRASLDDQKRLARLDPANTATYRARFEEVRRLLSRVEILALSRARITRTFELLLLTFFGLSAAIALAVYWIEQRNREQRLATLRSAIESLSRGDTGIELRERRRDLIGQIAAMIEETSNVMTRQRRRTESLEHLSSWQEAARRHAHEIRTPLTAAQLEVTRLVRSMKERAPDAGPELDAAERSILEEFEQLRAFTAAFVSFARVGEPQLQLVDLRAVVMQFVELFGANWPELRLSASSPATPVMARIDREMIRQVLVNLCSNSALAGASTVVITVDAAARAIDVMDDGPGVPTEIRARLFEPYTTTRRIGEGMGLGLAISRKIMLDHGGDLELQPHTNGARFRLQFAAGGNDAG